MKGEIKFVESTDPQTGKPCERPVFFLDGRKVRKREFFAAFPAACADCGSLAGPPGACKLCAMLAAGSAPGGAPPECWPMRSQAYGALEEQVPELIARNERHGLTGVTYEKVDRGNGAKVVDAVFSDRAARARMNKFEGMHDRDSFGGD